MPDGVDVGHTPEMGESRVLEPGRRPGKRLSFQGRRTDVMRASAHLATSVADASERLAEEMVMAVDARHGQDLLGLARRSGLDDTTAEEAVQDALVRLWLEVRRGTAIREPRAWTFRTLYRIAMDHHRFTRRARELAERLRGDSDQALDPDPARRLSIWPLVDQLPTRQRQVIYLRYQADLPFEEVGFVMGITASGARAHATKAGVALRRALGPEWDD